ncbi:MAG TPA: M28 family metallopeptidase [Gemmatimonadales bacterium]|nr:M28 family metallopeptidase [Gemmatimonadales bacterium]
MRPLVLFVVAFVAAAPLAAQTPVSSDPRIAAIVDAVAADSLRADVTRLVGFGTRHTLSDTLSPTRGIGAARRWVKAEFDRISAACGGCLDVFYVGGMVGPTARIPQPTDVVNVIAVQRGTSDTGRYVLMSGDIDSRVTDIMDANDSEPGANDNASGLAGTLEAARVLTHYKFAGSIVYAALSAEEQGLDGGTILAKWVQQRGWRLVGVINNDMIGNVQGIDGITDNSTARVFSDGTPPTETEQERARRRLTGGEVDGVSRQLARYIKTVAERYVPALDIWLIYRLDRFGRGGHHRPFADLGYPAVRLMEMHENYTRQHQNVRVENGVAYGDVLEGVDFDYARKITSLDAATLAALSWAPAPPRAVRLGGAVQPAAVLTWSAPEDSADVAGYRVYWRRTDSPTWDHWEDVGLQTRHVFTGRIVDNYFFGVASVSREGDESVVVFPTPGR